MAAVLVMVIDYGGPAFVGVPDDLVDFVGAICLVQTHLGTERCEALFQLVDGF